MEVKTTFSLNKSYLHCWYTFVESFYKLGNTVLERVYTATPFYLMISFIINFIDYLFQINDQLFTIQPHQNYSGPELLPSNCLFILTKQKEGKKKGI